MGYESTLIFGVYRKPTDEERESAYFETYGTYCQIIATVDLSCMGGDGEFGKLLHAAPRNEDRLSICHRSADEATESDMYSDEPFQVFTDPQALIEALRADYTTTNYRRALLGLATVVGWAEVWSQFSTGDVPVIIHFGH